MHATYTERGLRILGFPSNQFGKQEPGTEAQIKEFAKSYNAEFDLFSKIDVNGENAHPLWKWMKEQPKGKGTLGNNIKWNFTKVSFAVFYFEYQHKLIFRVYVIHYGLVSPSKIITGPLIVCKILSLI
ncbi:GPX4 peroxidase, partial [Amia calva]|nr:GPX4 peroxidase [Amia calva]